MSNGLRSLFEHYIKEKRFLSNLSPRTIDSYKEVFERYVRFVGEDFPTQDRLDSFVLGMHEANFSVTTVNITIRSFNVFLSWLHTKGLIPALRMKLLGLYPAIRWCAC